MFTRITVGIDGSAPSFAALRWALDNAAAPETDFVLEHVVVDDRAAGERALERAVDASAFAGVRGQAVLATGDPAVTLTRDSHPGELLVIGSHKTGYLRGRVTGTRSVLIPAMAPCTTAVVPLDTIAQRHGVVVGVSSHAEYHAAVTVAANQARRRGDTLSLLCSTPDSQTGRLLLAEAAELVALVAPDIVVRQRLSPRRPVDALLDASRFARLLVVGAPRHELERPGVPGSVMHEVLLNLNSPVMVAR